MTWKEKYNKKYGYSKDQSHSLSDISVDTGVSEKGLQEIYNKGIGAWKTNIGSVRLKKDFSKDKNTAKYPRKTRLGKEQWAMARVYSAVMGGKASKVDKNELQMEKGGSINNNFDRADFYEQYYKNLSPKNVSVKQKGGKIEIDIETGGAIDTNENLDAVDTIFFKKGGKTDFNPDGSIKDKIVHSSGDVGGMLVGKRHSEGGIKAINKSTGQPLEMEGGEVVITRDAVSDKQKRMFNGKYMTNREILSEINVSGGGVSFADGGEVPNTIAFSDSTNFEFGGNTMCGCDIAKRLSYGGNFDNVYKTGGIVSEADFPRTLSDATFVKDLGGSTGAKLYEYEGKQFVAKKGNSEWHIAEERRANYLYDIMGIDVPLFDFIDGNTLVKQYIGDVRNVNWNNEAEAKKVLKGFVADALLANWDVYKNDNILIEKSTGKPYRIDNGGALRYRAQGDVKVDFDKEVGEVKTLADNNPQIKKYLTPEMIREQIDYIVDNNNTILESLNSQPRLKEIMAGRILYLNENKDELAEYFNTPSSQPKTTSTNNSSKLTIDDLKDKFTFDEESKFKGSRKGYLNSLTQQFLDRGDKVQKDINALLALLPSFTGSKDAILRAKIINEISRLQNEIDYKIDSKLEELVAERNDLFSTEGLLKYYFTQTTQPPVNNDLKPCGLPTPNGKKSKLPISAYINVRTPQFKKWFGDWESSARTNNYVNCSKMVDEETLEPRMFYHGVRKFQGVRGASAMGSGIRRPYGEFNPPNFSASFFADNLEYAKFYSGLSDNLPQSSRSEGFVYSVFLNIRNFVDLRPLGFESSYKDLRDYLIVKYGVFIDYNKELLKRFDAETSFAPIWNFIRNDEVLIETLKQYGYDALFQIGDIPTFENGEMIQDRSKWKRDNEYLTFYPNQVKGVSVKKSYYMNIFDDIRFKKGGYVRL
jgi:hypothetical protein